MNDLMRVEAGLPLGSLETYIHWTNQLPMLKDEQEKQLTLLLFQTEDLDAARQLILSHLRFVVKIARGYLGYGLPLNDLIQEGNVGLMKAVKRFDPQMNVRLATFALHWIRSEIHEYVLKNWRIVKVATTKAQRKLFFNLRKSSKTLSALTARDIDLVAEELNVRPADVRTMQMRLSAFDTAFDAPTDADSTGDHSAPMSLPSPAASLGDAEANPARIHEQANWSTHQLRQLKAALTELDARSRFILKRRFLDHDKAKLKELATQFGISLERVRQIEKRALQTLRLHMGAKAS